MKSATLGKNISGAEVTNISKHGFWVLLADQEIFVAFKAFPWFKGASVEEIITIEWPQPHHLYWPALIGLLSTSILLSRPFNPLRSSPSSPKSCGGQSHPVGEQS